MADHKSKVIIPMTPTTIPDATYTRQRITQNFILIWADADIDVSKNHYKSVLEQLHYVVNELNTFTDPDQCVDFLTDIDQDIKAFMIAGYNFTKKIMHLIHDIPQLDTIIITCNNNASCEEWAKNWTKLNGVYTEISAICEALQLITKQCNEDSIALSFLSVGEGASGENLNQLEPSFMYTQIFKEILLDMHHGKQAVEDLTKYCRVLYSNNVRQLNIIDEFESTYEAKKSIWWYTRECFTYQMLNYALRNLDGDTIINMGFFISDLHRQIEDLYKQQVSNYEGKTFLVYRGQGLSSADFEKLRKTKGGLMSFNNFLSTSKNREVSLKFAKRALGKTDMVGIFFIMTIDPQVSSAPFAAIHDCSYFQKEEEILFSMHTVFRISDIKQIDNSNPIYQVELQLTADDDEQLGILTKHMREEVNGSGWSQIGMLLLKIGQFKKAEELYQVLLEKTSHKDDKASCYINLGAVKTNQGDYKKAIWYYEQGLQIQEKTLPPNHPGLATSYNNIGMVYYKMGEYSKALSFYEKALEICQKTLPPNHPNLAASYNNIGMVYYTMGEYSKALPFFEKSLDISEKTLPPNHPDLATSYNNIGSIYKNMGQYSNALSFYEKTREIFEKTLPANHPSLAISYNSIGVVYESMGEYSKALSFYQKSLEIRETTVPANHPSLATSYNNIAVVYTNMKEYSKALSFYEKSLEFYQKTLPSNHPDLATPYNNIAAVYIGTREYSKALSFFERALNIFKSSLPSNHPKTKSMEDNIKMLKQIMQ